MAHWLIDTNILLYLANSAAEEHAAAKDAVARLLAAGETVAIAPQILFEFWSVATRPLSANGLAWTAAQTRAAIEGFRGKFAVLAEPPEVIDLWLGFVTAYSLKGARVHDARILATMQANGISRLLTLHTNDFPRDPAFTIVSPGEGG